jgi:hypothetical protein
MAYDGRWHDDLAITKIIKTPKTLERLTSKEQVLSRCYISMLTLSTFFDPVLTAPHRGKVPTAGVK